MKKINKLPEKMSFGPIEYDAKGNYWGSRIFLYGCHHMPKKEAHKLGLYGCQSKLDKDFCVITEGEYMRVNEENNKIETVIRQVTA